MKFRKFLCFVLIFAIVASLNAEFSIFSSSASAACSHSTLGTQYSEIAHPHYYFRSCLLCGEKVYTGGHATKNHGDGTYGSGTCPSCGTHSYPNPTTEQTLAALQNHPHKLSVKCKCGSIKNITQFVNPDCSSCITAYNIKNKSVIKNDVLYLSYLDGDAGSGAAIVFPVPVKITYQSQYSKSGSNFTSYSSKLKCVFTKTSIPVGVSPYLIAIAQADYYNSSNSKIYSVSLSGASNNPTPTERTGSKFTKSPVPSYSQAGAMGYAGGILYPRSSYAKLTYTF